MQLGVARSFTLPLRCLTRQYATTQIAGSTRSKPKNKTVQKAPVPKETPAQNASVTKETAVQNAASVAKETAVQNAASVAKETPAHNEERNPELRALDHIERIVDMSKKHPDVDVWDATMDVLDLHMPHVVNFSSRHHYNGWRSMYEQFSANRINDLKNASCLFLMATQNAFSGYFIPTLSTWQMLRRWPGHVLFDTHSTKPNSWLRYTRQEMFETYTKLNSAIASHDRPTIKKLAFDQQLKTALQSTSRHPGLMNWHCHGEVTPSRILSIRALEANMAPTAPKFGHRLKIQALVRFDTQQSLEIYDKYGNAVHEPRADQPNGHDRRVFAEPKRVTEYMVMEKTGWADRPWRIREQYYPTNPAPLIHSHTKTQIGPDSLLD